MDAKLAALTFKCKHLCSDGRIPIRGPGNSVKTAVAVSRWFTTVERPTSIVGVKVHKSEEKGSDVNLAAYLLLDGFQKDYDAAAVVTNDSDLAEPVRMVRDELGLKVEVLDPCGTARTSAFLQKVSTFYKPIRQRVLAVCQFPNPMTDATGQFHKPTAW